MVVIFGIRVIIIGGAERDGSGGLAEAENEKGGEKRENERTPFAEGVS